MASGVRGDFRRDLDRLDDAVAGWLALVPEAVVTATTVLLVSDHDRAEGIERWAVLVEEMYRDVEHTIEAVVARPSPVAGDLRFLLVCIRLVPRLHEVMHLIGEVAAPSDRAIGERLTPRVISLVRRLGELSAGTWEAVEVGWRTREERVVRVVRERRERVADVRSALAAQLSSGVLPLPAALEMAVVGRAFDRLGHHAAESARLVAALGPRAVADGVN